MRKSSDVRGVGHVGPPRPRAGGHAGPLSERGSVIAETAIAIPCLLAIGIALLWALGVGTTTLALSDAAGQAARAAARGESAAVVAGLAAQAAPRAQVAVQAGESLVSVVLSQQVSIPLPLLDGLAVTVQRSATAAREDLAP